MVSYADSMERAEDNLVVVLKSIWRKELHILRFSFWTSKDSLLFDALGAGDAEMLTRAGMRCRNLLVARLIRPSDTCVVSYRASILY